MQSLKWRLRDAVSKKSFTRQSLSMTPERNTLADILRVALAVVGIYAVLWGVWG